MKKQDIQIGEEYAYFAGYGNYHHVGRYGTRRYRDESVVKVKVIEFDWTEPEAADSIRYRRRSGTRVKVLKAPASMRGGIYKRGTEHAVRNKDIIASWADFTSGQAEGEIWAEYRKAEERANNSAEARIEEAWNSYVRKLGLPGEDAYEPGSESNFLTDGYGRPDRDDLIVFAEAVLTANTRGVRTAQITPTIERANKVRRKVIAEARKTRNAKLAEGGFEVPDDDEEDEE